MYVRITPALQRFYAARGMWCNGEPCSALAAMLGPKTPWQSLEGSEFFVTSAQIADLYRDIHDNGRRGLNGHQVGATLRRLREAAARGGVVIGMARPTHNPSPDVGVATPFEPLICPPPGKARQAFERHVMDCVHDVVARSQESTY
ncbi:MAG: hypothetical protein K2Q07_09245 [Burkholderiaceae bacterium]|nr:hypothetical protein [Burkholderiaceae bacterium]